VRADAAPAASACSRLRRLRVLLLPTRAATSAPPLPWPGHLNYSRVTVFWGLWKPEAFIFKPEEAELERMRAEIAALEKRQEAAEEQVSHAAVTEVTSVSLLPNSSGAGWSVSLHDAWTARSELAD